MRIFKYILPLFVILTACQTTRKPQIENIVLYDSVYVVADMQWHKQYYPLLERQVFSIDLLSEGLTFDSAHHITGTGLNLYFSDIFTSMNDSWLQDGVYRMDTTAEVNTFLPYQQFEGGNITGCYLLDIQESKIQRIIGFTAGAFEISLLGEDIRMDISLYTADSTLYRATYQGPADYR